MTEEPEQHETPAAAPPSHASPPLGGWRVPVFWMACGALLAGLAGGAVMLAQRIGVERDMAAVAALASPTTPTPPSMPPAAPTPPAPQPAPSASLSQAGAPATTPVVPAAAPPPVAAARTPPASEARTSSRAARATVVAKQAKAKRADAVSKPRKARAYRRKAAAEKSLYWEVFKRCPLPGEPGAVECRRHICNGAEGKGPACKSYRGKWR